MREGDVGEAAEEAVGWVDEVVGTVLPAAVTAVAAE